MAQLGQRFDATAHDTEQRDYAELPNGIYQMEIEASEVTETKSGTGMILKTTNVVIAPEEFKGRKLFNNYNIENQNPQAQEIGQRQFASLCRAIGAESVEDSEELHFRTFTVKVGLGKAQNGYPARAEIKAYYFNDNDPGGHAGRMPEPEIDAVQPRPAPANDNRAPAANDNRPQQAASRPAAAATGSRPWGKRA